jgi:hypothetical protein
MRVRELSPARYRFVARGEHAPRATPPGSPGAAHHRRRPTGYVDWAARAACARLARISPIRSPRPQPGSGHPTSTLPASDVVISSLVTRASAARLGQPVAAGWLAVVYGALLLHGPFDPPSGAPARAA